MLQSDEIPTVTEVSLRIPGLGSLTGISLNGEVDQYFGIPYAEVPARFRRSTPVTRWKDEMHDGTKLGPFCPQPPRDFYPVPTPDRPWLTAPYADEFHCLNLNISIPRMTERSENVAKGLPVMVFIHGGAFTYATAASPIFDGRILALKSAELSKPTIIVTINYRLGVYGFLAGRDLLEHNRTNGDSGVGNNGIWDQVLALRWVKKHIGAFGGDPNRVTVFGQSAGAVSVHAHLLRGEHLFSSAIMQSGHIGLCGILSMDDYQIIYERILVALGISLDLSAEQRIQKLVEMDAEKLTAAMEPAFVIPVVTMPLCDDGVLLEGPIPTWTSKFEVPSWCRRLIIGDAKNECIIWNKSWDNLSPRPLVAGQDLTTPTADLTLAKVEAILGGKPASKIAARYRITKESSEQDIFWALEKMTTEALFHAPISAAHLDAVGHGDQAEVYAYHFDVSSPYDNAWGGLAHHSYDNVLIWGILRHTVPAEQRIVADKMTEAWIVFANGGAPWQRSFPGRELWMLFGNDSERTGIQNDSDNVTWAGSAAWDGLRREGLLEDLVGLSTELCLRKSEALTPFPTI